MDTQQIADLAWAGQHERAIAAATDALKRKTLVADERMSLLDLRAESYIAVGDLKRAAADARAMKALARREGSAALKARERCCKTLVLVRQGEMRAAIASATTALQAARKSRRPELEALSLWRLAAAQIGGRIDLDAALRNAARAVDAFAALGDTVQQGRALQTKGSVYWTLDQNLKSAQCSAEALALARRCGDHFGIGSAINSIAIVETDLAAGLRLYSQALDAYKSGGYVLGQAMATGNLGASYADLGLYRRARRLSLDAADICRRAGAKTPLLVSTWNLAEWAFQAGSLDDARAFASEAAALTRTLRDKRFSAHISIADGWLAMREGRARRRRAPFRARREAGRIPRGLDATSNADRSRAGASRRGTPRRGSGRNESRGPNSPHPRFRSARLDERGGAVVAPLPGVARQRQSQTGGRGVGARAAIAARAHRGPQRRRAAPQLSQQARRESRNRPRVARACARAQAAEDAARSASGRQGQRG